jgi:sugar phosphate isomerase/epimerase
MGPRGRAAGDLQIERRVPPRQPALAQDAFGDGPQHLRLDDFRNNIELASKLGCKYIISSTGEAHFGEDETVNDEVLVQNIKSLLPLLEKHGITLAIEIHGDYGTGESLYAITQKVASPLVCINYDTANVFFYGGALPTADIQTCVGDVKYVHLKDKRGPKEEWNFPGVGNGELPLREFIDFMQKSGYEGPYSVEIEYTQEFCTREKDQPGDIDIANKEMADSYRFLSSIFGTK